MTWFSLKRTLQSNLASSIEVLNHINQDVAKSNLHNPLRYSTVLLSIGKTTQICHQDIPLKKVNCNGTVTYISAIPRKLANNWQCPGSEIAEILLTVLQEQTAQPIWSSIRKNNDWIEFVISQRAIEQWRQNLHQWALTSQKPAWPIEPEQLWYLQSGYELCCRWQRRYPIELFPPSTSARSPTATFLVSVQPLHGLIHCLLDICDSWHKTTPSQLLQQTTQLVMALQDCVAMTRLSSEARTVSHWLEPTRIVLQQSLNGRLGHDLVDRF